MEAGKGDTRASVCVGELLVVGTSDARLARRAIQLVNDGGPYSHSSEPVRLRLDGEDLAVWIHGHYAARA